MPESTPTHYILGMLEPSTHEARHQLCEEHEDGEGDCQPDGEQDRGWQQNLARIKARGILNTLCTNWQLHSRRLGFHPYLEHPSTHVLIGLAHRDLSAQRTDCN